jgi:hypothetical protein
MPHVRFGSKADMCSAKAHVRFTPDSDRESGLSQRIMSALPLKADMCGAIWDFRFGSEADTARGVTRYFLVYYFAGLSTNALCNSVTACES